MVDGLRLGREQSYSRLFQEYYRPLSVFAFKYVHDLDTAREIVQDLFVSIFESRNSLVITTSLKSYLYRSVRNRCLNHIKHRGVEKKHMDQMELENESSNDVEDRIMETELEHRIFQIVSDLPTKCREIFLMSRVKGLKNREIADQVDISIRTVEKQISNALKVLRQHLGKEYIP